MPPLTQRRVRGSAFMELLFALIVVAALVSFIVPTYYQFIDKARRTLARNTVDSMGKSLAAYKKSHNLYPTQINFTTGKDGSGTTVFPHDLLDQVNTDFSSIDSYIGNQTTYKLTVRAADKDLTTITLTPSKVTY